MTSTKKKRLSMLDSLAAAGAPAPSAAPSGVGSMMSTNRALRSARDAVDGHNVWELDPLDIVDDRLADRLDPADVMDLRDAIEQNGQTVPILVRRHPVEADKYLLVYGRRRLEAIRLSDKVAKVRALIANLDDTAALTAQISENMARRDLSYIEKALFAKELIDSGFGNQNHVAEVLTVTKSSVSMALAIVEMVGADLIRAIGPAHGVGRPKWEALGKALEGTRTPRSRLIEVAERAHTDASVAAVTGDGPGEDTDPSVQAFEAVLAALPAPPAQPAAKPARKATAAATRPLSVGGGPGGVLKRSAKGLTITLDNGAFADWVETEAQELIDELHARWTTRAED